jgi:hypothetical protein
VMRRTVSLTVVDYFRESQVEQIFRCFDTSVNKIVDMDIICCSGGQSSTDQDGGVQGYA